MTEIANRTDRGVSSAEVLEADDSKNGMVSEEPENEVVMPAIVDRIAEISARVPMSAWKAAPTDGAKNLKHYLYGWPKDSDA